MIYYSNDASLPKSDWDFVIASQFATEMEITDLEPQKPYTFCMRSKNEYGFSPWSDCASASAEVISSGTLTNSNTLIDLYCVIHMLNK